MDTEPARHLFDADVVGARCSHSVHFALREACSRSSTWFHRCADNQVIEPAMGIGFFADTFIPRRNELLNPRSPVPATLHCVHHWVTSRNFNRQIDGKEF